MRNGYDHHHHHFHQKTIFMPMFCRLSIKEITLNNHRKNPISAADDPSSPKVSCMGQVKQNNRVIGATHHHRYSKLRRLFSSKIPLPPTTVSSTSALAGGGNSGSKSFRSGSDVSERDLRRLKLKSDDDDRCGQRQDCVKVVVNIGELDPPLPVVKKVASPVAGCDEVNLWRRRFNGAATLKGLQIGQIRNLPNQM
ncbi:hypothetical protein OROMI_032095 [Orobanche minor]